MTTTTLENKLKVLDIAYHEEADPNGRWFKHSYTRNSDGKLLAGVSSVASLGKRDDLMSILNQWAANCATNYIWQFFGELKTQDNAGNYIVNKNIIESVLKEAKVAHRNLSKEAKEIGQDVHDLLEQYIQAKIEGRKIKLDVKDEDIKRAITQFVKWEKENKVIWLAAELLVGNEDLELAGRLDALAIVNGKKTILDWKVANNISESYFLQLAGYWLCVENMGWQPEARMLIRIPKTATKKVWNDKERKYEVVENNLEVIVPPTDLNFDKETFIHLRSAYKWLNQQILKLK